jgi:hypothetical protein
VNELVLERLDPALPSALYVEAPYGVGAAPEGSGARGHVLWERVSLERAHLRAKGRACRAYRSQFGVLRPHLPRRFAVPELWPWPEWVGWTGAA